VQFQITWSAPATAAEWFNLTLTPSGGTPVAAQLVTVVPAAGVAQQNVSVSVYVPLAGDGTTTSIVLTGTVNAASVLTATVAAVSVTYVPLVP
jgi:hypothetical protein